MPHRMYDVPALGRPLVPRRRRDVAVVLDAFAPTHLDAWTGRVVAVTSGVQGAPSAPPLAVGADLVAARAVVVRHTGDVRGRTPWFGAARRCLAAVTGTDPPARPWLGVVVEAAGTAVLWLPDDDPAKLARDLSRADWRAFTG